MYSNRRPYYGLKLSIADFFREPVRYLKQSNTQESMMEKPYLVDEYPKMHLRLPDFKFRARERFGPFGQIADGNPIGGLAFIDYGDAKCRWGNPPGGICIEGEQVITLVSDYFWSTEFDFVVRIADSNIPGITIKQLPGTKAGARDEQDYLLTFPENARGVVTICGVASTTTLVSQTFKTVVAGMPVGIYFIGAALVAIEKGQLNPAILVKSTFGDKGADCGCIEIETNCGCGCGDSFIGYTTQQMEVNDMQTLTVIAPADGCTYDWSISSGGGSLSAQTGLTVDYTAPSSNVDCLENPTIALSVGVHVCDALNIAVNAYAAEPNYWAYRMVVHDQVSECSYAIRAYIYNCSGVQLGLWENCSSCDGSTLGDCAPCCTDYYYDPPGCWGNWKCNEDKICTMEYALSLCSECAGMGCAAGDSLDLRSEVHKSLGCCPEGLL